LWWVGVERRSVGLDAEVREQLVYLLDGGTYRTIVSNVLSVFVVRRHVPSGDLYNMSILCSEGDEI
jgi:hypothetical protein